MPITSGYLTPHPPVVLPEVGRGRETEISVTSKSLGEAAEKIAAQKPDVIIVITPHGTSYADYFHISPGGKASGGFGQFGAPGVKISVSYDERLAKRIGEKAEGAGIPAGGLGEKNAALDHGAMVPLYFIGKRIENLTIVRVSLSGLPRLTHYRFGACIRDAVDELGLNAVIIASGDLSHKLTKDGPYGFAKEGPEFDSLIMEASKKADFMKFLTVDESFCSAAAECGLGSLVIMAGAFDARTVRPEFYSYEGPLGVGYGVCGFYPGGEDEGRRFGKLYGEWNAARKKERKGNESAYVAVARRTLESYVRDGKVDEEIANEIPPELAARKAGVFVSLKKDGNLRGCIGTISPTKDNVALEIIANAVSSGTRDNRFSPVTADELDDIVYSVDVLGEAEPISGPEMLDVKRYGVIVSCGYKRGLLLPDLAGVDTVEEQIRIAMQKGGIKESEPYELERFEVVRHC